MLPSMSALTFETLSTELTQALAEQSDTPPDTKARCTLGRDKVMVLVEYPLNSDQSEPSVSETLDWLEQQLRQQFDTAGLPEAAADLADAGSEILVQLFLKHLSELKPFTMRSFIWKVDDGFDDLFGTASNAAIEEEDLNQTQPQKALAEVGPLKAGSSQLGQTSAFVSTAPRRKQTNDDVPFFHSALEYPLTDEVDDEVSDTDVSSTGISAIKTGVLPENIAAEQPAFTSVLPEPTLSDRVLSDSVLSELEAQSDEDSLPAELGGEDLQLEIESDLALDLDLDDDINESSESFESSFPELEEDSMTLMLPDESPELESEDFSLPTVEIPDSSISEMGSAHADFFTIDSSTPPPERVDSTESDLAELDEGDRTELSDYNLTQVEPVEPVELSSVTAENQTAENQTAENQTADVLEPIAFEFIDFQAMANREVANNSATTAFDSDEPDSDEPDSDESLDNKEAFDEEAPHEYEEGSAYYLEGEEEDGERVEAVASVDEREVQRQREQWEQQSRSRPWIFAGALGLVVMGVLGFVLTRPCTFGSCDRLQTAQQSNKNALDDLRIDSSLASVTDAKQQLKRSVGLLAPIPIWSPYYRQAQAVLPGYESQVRSLDYITSAQEKAYKAALASQDPPHPVSRWQEIAEDWRLASEMLEAVPANSPVREVADSKLTEYRANRATILVRIDSEEKAEVGIRQAQKAASLGKKQIEAASNLEDWEDALASWESAVDNLSQIPQGTNAHGEAQKLLPEYLKTLEEVRVNTEAERSASRSLFQAKQLAVEAKKAEADEQWSAAIENWQAASRQLQDIQPKTLAHTEAEPLKDLYTTSFSQAENNFQAALRFQPIEPNFFAVCGMAGAQKCAYSVQSGNIRLDLFQGYDTVIDQSITPPDQRAIEASAPQLVGQSNQMLQEITTLSTQAQVPVELYDAQGKFLARYRPDLSGFTRSLR